MLDGEVHAIECRTGEWAVTHDDVPEVDAAVDGPVLKHLGLGTDLLVVLDNDLLEILPLKGGCKHPPGIEEHLSAESSAASTTNKHLDRNF
jgi:hypothetical protein